jgi:hypothetical protein
MHGFWRWAILLPTIGDLSQPRAMIFEAVNVMPDNSRPTGFKNPKADYCMYWCPWYVQSLRKCGPCLAPDHLRQTAVPGTRGMVRGHEISTRNLLLFYNGEFLLRLSYGEQRVSLPSQKRSTKRSTPYLRNLTSALISRPSTPREEPVAQSILLALTQATLSPTI